MAVRYPGSGAPRPERDRPVPRGDAASPAGHATIAAMRDDVRFDEIIDRLAGFHGTWLAYLGLELGLFAAIRAADAAGITPGELVAATGTDLRAVETWAWAADAHGLIEFGDDRMTIDPDMAAVLLDVDRPDHLGGQIVHAVVASMDWSAMAGFFRTGTPVLTRPDRYREAIERLTYQDIAVFFQEVLSALPQLTADLARGGRVADVHCGGGRWLVAMARRFPALELIGVESEADSVARARSTIATAGLADRIRIHEAAATDVVDAGPVDLVYLQYALHLLPNPVDVLGSAWRALRPGGRIVVLDWPLPETAEEFRTRYGELVVGVQLDELFQGTALATRDQFRSWFAAAALPAPALIDLPSGAMALVAERPA
jgi:SAM-dependent methyltransferase